MATFMTLPTELRLQIYRELFVLKREPRLDQHVGGRIICCTYRTFYTAILEVSKKVHEEAKSILYGETACTLHIYLIFKGCKIHGSDVKSALHSLSRSEHFPYVRNCILDIRLFRGEAQENNTSFSGVDTLRANVKSVRQILFRAPGLKEIEVSWRSYFNLDLAEPRCRSLEPLDQLPVKYKLSVSKVEKTSECSDCDFYYWPNMLKAYRVVLFVGVELMVVHMGVGWGLNRAT